ncbi:MAG: sulfotransferase domain-containing protein [Candidatus Scalindua rubra]|uniref:Sulfotransferase n=1 Tax=Candidatus Scalindua brodae TaxID=237368 RepID=A0A0B0ERM9_9BACT|nr:MAG: sulfotransferase [Candidatus Scalindua brodae]MBZ0109950.1 sulfotransferase domain-containing protein [Candidatus Scalindua rubra]TWU35476.1 Sulfotransferase domain protein [Candidatus Brocadiaceae bacterium S225]
MIGNIKKPEFFIVGAPKCGTTALDFHLSLHPEIFMAPKEKHYFMLDEGINIKLKSITRADYVNFFASASHRQVCGESSVWYLYSENVAKKIYQFNPEAKIIIILRNPKKMLPSLHSQFLYDADEHIVDFKTALLEDIERIKKGKKVKTRTFENRPGYINSVLYYEQVKRYLSVFDSGQVTILLHNKVKDDFEGAYRSILKFLQVSTDFFPSEQQVNVNKKIKSVKLHSLSKRPPEKLKKIFRTIIPFKPIRSSLIKIVESLNVSEKNRDELSEEVKELVNKYTKDDVLMLAKLIDKDLSDWLR